MEGITGVSVDIAIDVMRAIKRERDPLGIMNPGKIFASAAAPARC